MIVDPKTIRCRCCGADVEAAGSLACYGDTEWDCVDYSSSPERIMRCRGNTRKRIAEAEAQRDEARERIAELEMERDVWRRQAEDWCVGACKMDEEG